MSTKSKSGFNYFFFSVFALLGLLGGTLIVIGSALVGIIFYVITESDYTKTIATALNDVLWISYIIYQFTLCVLMSYMIRARKSNWKNYFLLCVAMPIMIFSIGGNFHPLLGLILLIMIASLAWYHVIIIRHYQRHPIKSGD
ncbi:MAG: hypothetical protein Q7S04_02530 [Candidatus Moranbacteria bacterium]|nr:hypothetical protein [Candidatus Moranbacteria bacterium]